MAEMDNEAMTANFMDPVPVLTSTTERSLAASNDTVTGYFFQVEQLTFLWILFILIVIGNSTVLIALMLSKGRKSRMNFFIKHLAAADLCVGLISVLTDIVWKITISWEAGLIACKVIRFSQAVVTYASTYVLVALSIDRYDAITHPMNFSGSWKRAKGLVIAAWLLSILFSLPILHFYETTETEHYGTQCWIDFDQPWKWRLHMTLVSLTVFVIPAILIAACYIIIVVTIWKKSKDIHVASSPTALGNGNDRASGRTRCEGPSSCEVLIKKRQKKSDHNDEMESRRASSRGLIPKAKVKTIKMTFVIIFVFILCWSPYIVFDLLQVYGCIPSTKFTMALATFIQSLAPLNSAANPIIYCLFSTNAGQNICSLFCGKKRPSGSAGRNGRLLASHNTAQTTKSTTLQFDSTSGGHAKVKATASGVSYTPVAIGATEATNVRKVKALVSNNF